MAKEGCFSCGASFNGTEKDMARLFKEQFEKHGTSRYFYKLETNGGLYFVRAEYFDNVLKTQIKPNFKHGAEFAHISEFR